MAHKHAPQPNGPRTWLLPLTLVALGAYSWACVEDPDLSGTSMEEPDGSSSDTDDPGPGTTGDASTTTTTTGSTTASSASTTGGSADVTPRDVLESIALQVIVPNTAEFVDTTAALQTAVEAYAAAVDADPVAAGVELSAAQDAWRTAMASWQRLEVMQLGPKAPSSEIAGENLRDEIYSWPTTDTCTVDRRLVGEDYVDDTFFLDELVLAYGLDALEYLLFIHDQGHTCPSQIQLDGPWTGLGFEEVERRRGAYAARVAGEIARQADVLATRWSPEGDNVAAQLANPGGYSPWESEAVALDDVYRAIFYISKQTKDAKVGRSLGLTEGCAAVPCPDLFESPFGRVSAAAVADNLDALKQLIWGGTDPGTSAGFDDLLINAGQADLAIDLVNKIDIAIAMARAFEQPLQQVVVSDIEAVEDLHAALKDVTDILKGPFVMTLMLTVPAEGAGDAD